MFDPQQYPYPSQRQLVYSKRGMAATSHPLASQAGIEAMQKGGNAIDAAIAAAACLTVVEPTSNGIGGDTFAMVWTKGRLYGLNSSGPAPQQISIEALKAKGMEKMPVGGWEPVTVPGAPAAWAALSKRFGKLPFPTVLQPAADHARHGHPVAPTVARAWQRTHEIYQKNEDKTLYEEWYRVFTCQGAIPQAGDLWQSEDHARTLEEIGATHAESFYRGPLAEKIAKASAAGAGWLNRQDLAAFDPEWVEPISADYKGYQVWELPPNGQGIVALAALNILQEFQGLAKEDELTIHRQIEAIKAAFSAGRQSIADPGWMEAGAVSELLSPSFAAKSASRIGDRARLPETGSLPNGGTVYLCTADEEGNMVSLIQSNYYGFGSGIVVPDTGIALQNRGFEFSLDPEHPNALAGGKRPYHTIMPGFLTRKGQPIGPFGMMGGYMQPQGHVQMLMNVIDFRLNPQAALDAPRFQWLEGNKVEVEQHFPRHLAQALAARGHEVAVALDSDSFGRGQFIWKDRKSGVLAGATEPRCDGSIAVF